MPKNAIKCSLIKISMENGYFVELSISYSLPSNFGTLGAYYCYLAQFYLVLPKNATFCFEGHILWKSAKYANFFKQKYLEWQDNDTNFVFYMIHLFSRPLFPCSAQKMLYFVSITTFYKYLWYSKILLKTHQQIPGWHPENDNFISLELFVS